MTSSPSPRAGCRAHPGLGLAAHTAAFVLVNLGIAVQSGFAVDAGVFWGWGIGLNAHAFSVMRTTARRRPHLVTRRARRW